MRNDLHDPQLFNALIKSFAFSHARKTLDTSFIITPNGALVNFLDPNGSDRDVTLPPRREGLFYTIANIGAANNLLVRDYGGTLLSTVAPGQSFWVIASESEWRGLKSTSDLDVFTNTVDGLVPAPNSAVPGSLFLRDDGQWAQVQVVGIVDAFKYISDGTNIAVGAGPDTFRLRSSTSKIGITVTNNEAIFGDNANLTVNEAFVDHNALLNYVADQHVAHSSVSISAGQGLSGGGNIAASRTLALDINGLSVIAPVLGDSIPFYDLSGTTQGKTTFTTLNGILDHNALLNYVANQHIDHSGVSVIAGTGMSGGGAITSSVTLNLNINGLSTDTPVLADSFAFFDASGSDHNKATFTALNGILDHNSLLNYVANEHINHTSVTLTAGAGLTGGGTIAANRTFTVGAGTGITVNADDVALAAIADQRIMANISGGSLAPSAQTLTAILDNIIGSTRGMLLVRKSTAWQALAIGTTTQFLGNDGTDVLWETPAGGGDLLSANNLSDVASAATSFANIKQAATTAATGVVQLADSAALVAKTASRALTADLGVQRTLATGTIAGATLPIVLTSYTAYRALKLYASLSPSTDAQQLQMQTSTNGGSTYDGAAGNYRYALWSMADDTTTISGSSSTGDTKILLTSGTVGNASNESVSIELTIINQTSTSLYTLIQWQACIIDDSGRVRNTKGSAARAAAADVDAIALFFPSGNINGNWTLTGIT